VLLSLVAVGRLERVLPAPALADRLMTEARTHLDGARLIVAVDPCGSLQLAYDAARKAATALLAAVGLRATTRGGHLAVQEAVAAFGVGFRSFDRLRRRRHEAEYPGPTTPTTTAADAEEGIEQAAQLVTAAVALLASGGPPLLGEGNLTF